jgi:CelD/BcsL family acetyltransferase involved in cellulose biosynthesis
MELVQVPTASMGSAVSAAKIPGAVGNVVVTPGAAESGTKALPDGRESEVGPIPLPVAPRYVTVDVATTPEELAALKLDYDRLHLVCRNTLPFALHEWHAVWWEQLARTEGKVRDALRIHVVRDDRGQCVAIVPFVSTIRELGRLRTESIGLLGADPNLTELRSPLVTPGTEALVSDAVVRHLAGDRGWDWVRWSGIQGRFGDEVAAATALAWQTPVLDYVVDLAPTWDAFRTGLKRNIRESLRHCYNSLKRDGLKFEFEVAQTPDDVRNALHTFLSLHAMRAALTNTVTHPHRFETDTSRRFLYEVCDRLAQRGSTRVFVLKIRGCIVATRVAFVVGDQLYLYYSGYDPRWAKYSVSTTILAEAFKYAIEQGLTAANLSTGTDVSKTRWGARAVPFPDAVQVQPRVRSRVAYGAYRALLNAQSDWLGPLASHLPKRAWT